MHGTPHVADACHRAEIDSLLCTLQDLQHATSLSAVRDAFQYATATPEEDQLSQQILDAAAKCQLFTEVKREVLKLCKTGNTEMNVICGLLANIQQEGALLAAALVKSNCERDQNPPSAQKDHRSGGRSSRETIAELHPQKDEVLKVEQSPKQQHGNSQKQEIGLNKSSVEIARSTKMLDEVKRNLAQAEKVAKEKINENLELSEKISKLTIELGKVNALKHENLQLKKRLAASTAKEERFKCEQIAQNKTREELVTSNVSTSAKDSGTQTSHASQEQTTSDSEFTTLKVNHEQLASQLGSMHVRLKDQQELLEQAKKSEGYARKELLQEQAARQNWQRHSEVYAEENLRLQEELNESLEIASSCRNKTRDLEQTFAKAAERLSMITQEKAEMDRANTEVVHILLSLQCATEKLVCNVMCALLEAEDPRTVIRSTTEVMAKIEQYRDSVVSQSLNVKCAAPLSAPWTLSDLQQGSWSSQNAWNLFAQASPSETSSHARLGSDSSVSSSLSSANHPRSTFESAFGTDGRNGYIGNGALGVGWDLWTAPGQLPLRD